MQVVETGEVIARDTAPADGEGQGGLPHALQSHIGPLDGLRGWAALMVVIGHLHEFGINTFVTGPLGNYGVFLFFVLSGFLMGHLYMAKPINAGRVRVYFAARVSRIVPLYYATVMAGFLIGRLADPAFPFAMNGTQLAKHLTFGGSVSVFWSIGPEFQFYFLFPLLWWIVSIPRARAEPWIVSAAFTTILAVTFRSMWPGIFVLSKLHIFLVGIGLASLRRHIKGEIARGPLIAMQLSALLILMFLLLPQEIAGSIIYPTSKFDLKHNEYYQDFGKLFLLGWVVFAFTFESQLANVIFSNRVMKIIGKYSFSIYLLHVPIIYLLVKGTAFDALVLPLKLLVLLGTILCACALSFRLLEEPARVATRKWLIWLFERIGDWLAPRGAGDRVAGVKG
ncbi:acyltransferase family protein [Sphingomonas profundi]|uniref:acyltransferase family protein n=1 Tax=Alterirhizorhabdus profundi TaxID=2681549 RepID=UPI0018D19B1F|nr:acyltransferase [Sphingomonas profundi]